MSAKQTMTSEEALRLLVEGNARFAAGKPKRPHCTVDRRMEVASGQSPFTVIVSCSDSRVPPEIVFDCGIGDLFVVRVAGNVVDSAVIGSLVLAVNHFGCPLVVVLGHESCDAISVALSSDEALIREPVPVIKMAEMIRENIPESLAETARDDAAVTRAVREHIASVVRQIVEEPFIAERIAEGMTRVIPAYYSLAKGTVLW